MALQHVQSELLLHRTLSDDGAAVLQALMASTRGQKILVKALHAGLRSGAVSPKALLHGTALSGVLLEPAANIPTIPLPEVFLASMLDYLTGDELPYAQTCRYLYETFVNGGALRVTLSPRSPLIAPLRHDSPSHLHQTIKRLIRLRPSGVRHLTVVVPVHRDNPKDLPSLLNKLIQALCLSVEISGSVTLSSLDVTAPCAVDGQVMETVLGRHASTLRRLRLVRTRPTPAPRPTCPPRPLTPYCPLPLLEDLTLDGYALTRADGCTNAISEVAVTAPANGAITPLLPLQSFSILPANPSNLLDASFIQDWGDVLQASMHHPSLRSLCVPCLRLEPLKALMDDRTAIPRLSSIGWIPVSADGHVLGRREGGETVTIGHVAARWPSVSVLMVLGKGGMGGHVRAIDGFVRVWCGRGSWGGWVRSKWRRKEGGSHFM
ncbi:unnamed protein product [Vitrella brassicaformis CCMP3155]|uniref:Uncharacterized protein n=3 Tax=Vitrella brassicaformis TaxID=1169539 RepID=A0A0G4EI60_VITBC|nr:unnamed protein product [Vitrella brassicaformis CCMP3155]|eukprot:CEL95666.1 unnamed protein product [Vitrella brassicaformis CCMP3155]